MIEHTHHGAGCKCGRCGTPAQYIAQLEDQVTLLCAQVSALQQRVKEHEQFRRQHRDCDLLALERNMYRAALTAKGDSRA